MHAPTGAYTCVWRGPAGVRVCVCEVSGVRSGEGGGDDGDDGDDGMLC